MKVNLEPEERVNIETIFNIDPRISGVELTDEPFFVLGTHQIVIQKSSQGHVFQSVHPLLVPLHFQLSNGALHLRNFFFGKPLSEGRI